MNSAIGWEYAAVEDIAAPYLERTVGESSGTLYEDHWSFVYNFEYRGSNLYNYTMFKAQTNTTRAMFDLYDPIEKMVRAANDASDEDFATTMGAYLDLPGVTWPSKTSSRMTTAWWASGA